MGLKYQLGLINFDIKFQIIKKLFYLYIDIKFEYLIVSLKANMLYNLCEFDLLMIIYVCKYDYRKLSIFNND